MNGLILFAILVLLEPLNRRFSSMQLSKCSYSNLPVKFLSVKPLPISSVDGSEGFSSVRLLETQTVAPYCELMTKLWSVMSKLDRRMCSESRALQLPGTMMAS